MCWRKSLSTRSEDLLYMYIVLMGFLGWYYIDDSMRHNLLKHCNVLERAVQTQDQGSTHLLNAFTKRDSRTCDYDEALPVFM